MALEVLSEERLEATQRLHLVPPIPEPEPRVVVKRVMPDHEMLQVLTMLGNILAVRLMLLLSVVGAFALAWKAMDKPGTIWVLIAFAMLVVSPLTWLSQRRS